MNNSNHKGRLPKTTDKEDRIAYEMKKNGYHIDTIKEEAYSSQIGRSTAYNSIKRGEISQQARENQYQLCRDYVDSMLSLDGRRIKAMIPIPEKESNVMISKNDFIDRFNGRIIDSQTGFLKPEFLDSNGIIDKSKLDNLINDIFTSFLGE